MNDLEEIIYKHALLNAAKHKGSANPGAVMGSIMSNEPELRSKAKEIGPMSGKIVAKVNALSPEEQQAEMGEKLKSASEAKRTEVANAVIALAVASYQYLDIANDYKTFGYSWRLVSDNRIAGDIHEHWSFQDDLAFMNDRAGFDKAFDIRVVRLHVFRAMEGVIPV